jgi:tRNA-uridine 2-sulfurtransferase
MRKALILISGGLDSMLAAKLIMEQNIHVEGINFHIGFAGDCPNKSAIFHKKNATENPHNATWVAAELGIKLHIIDAVDDFKRVLFNPQHGFGANLNPCLDCKLFMIHKAKAWMEQHAFDFLVTGEVLGQRPMSQRADCLPLAVALTEDRILRPLSAKLLAPTLPEREGWVKREALEAFNGRNRKPQIELAKRFGFKDFPQPAGGCALTDPNFCERLKNLWHCRGNKNYSLADIQLLKIGRHINFSANIILIIGRDDMENIFLERFATTKILLQAHNYPGALVLVEGAPNEEDLTKIAQIAAFYSKGKNAASVQVSIRKPHANENFVEVVPHHGQ